MKQAELQKAAVELFAQRGYASTGIRDIGNKAGLNSATLYHYVQSKEDLLIGVMSETLTELLDLMNEIFQATSEPVIGLVGFVRTHVAFCALNPMSSKVTDQGVQSLSLPSRQKIIDLRDAFESILERILQRGKLTKTFDIQDARIVRLAIIEMNNGIADWFRPDGRLTITEVQKEFSNFACRMVGVNHPSESELLQVPIVSKLNCEPENDGELINEHN